MIWGFLISEAVKGVKKFAKSDEFLDFFKQNKDVIEDLDGDGDVDTADVTLLYIQMVASTWGHIANADGELQEEEEEKIYELMNTIIFTGTEERPPLITAEILELSGLKKKDIKKMILQYVSNPTPIKKITTFAENMQHEDFFYLQAVLVATANGDVDQDERELLEEFGEQLGLTKFEMKQAEKKLRV